MLKNSFLCLVVLFLAELGWAQITGVITDGQQPIAGATLYLPDENRGTLSTTDGSFSLAASNNKKTILIVSYVGYIPKKILIEKQNEAIGIVELEVDTSLEEVIISGNLKPVNRLESTIPVEVYSPDFLSQNPSPSLFEGIQFINGVRPQINCSICNTGDIHINGLEGSYTSVLIDGMPIVSSLASVYGLNGIPTGMIEKVEIIKGPAGTLYGSQAVGGLINVITKLPEYSPRIFSDLYGTSWQEYNAELGLSGQLGQDVGFLIGLNGYVYANPIDQNDDNFTDVTQQKRVSIFNKFNWKSSRNRKGSLALRYLYEDRWGGEMNWTPEFRGGDQVYGESIYTSRFELIGSQQFAGDIEVQYSYTDHDQNSFYGATSFQAKERNAFLQGIWRKNHRSHALLAGISSRYNWYDDNTVATAVNLSNRPNIYWLPGVFVEDEISLLKNHKLLFGLRIDHHSEHGIISSPRVGYKINFDTQTLLRLNFGTGFRVVNIFTEEHAALTGARNLIIEENLKPEQSYNFNLNFYKKIYSTRGWIVGLETSAWHTYFSNQILPDFDSNPNEIRYANLNGHAVSQGLGLNLELTYGQFRAQAGASILDVYTKDIVKTRPVFTEKWSATWALTIPLWNEKTQLNYTGNLYGPMRLPLLSDLDPRREFSPIWSIQNIKVSYKKNNEWTLFAGIKNLLDWTPAKNNPFLIARSEDPFDKNIDFNNPYNLSFDPSYIYAPNQGIRFFVGLNYAVLK